VAPPGARALGRVIDQVALFQIDSVNVLARAQYVPAFSRLGPYDPLCSTAQRARPTADVRVLGARGVVGQG
jgi:uncharacterized protein YcaQ